MGVAGYASTTTPARRLACLPLGRLAAFGLADLGRRGSELSEVAPCGFVYRLGGRPVGSACGRPDLHRGARPGGPMFKVRSVVGLNLPTTWMAISPTAKDAA